MANLLQSVRDNLSFLLVCLAITAGLVLLAVLAERFLLHTKRRLSAAHTITSIAMFSALAGVLMLVEIPLFFAPGFYKLDLSELPVLICAFYLGPVSGVICELLKVLIKLMIKGTGTAFVGDFANFLVGCSFVLPASVLYPLIHSKRGAVASMALGTVVMTVFGSMFNAWFLLPKFAELYGIPMDVIIQMGTAVNASIIDIRTLVLFAVVPFDLLKGLVVSALTFLLYKRIERVFFHRLQKTS